LAFAVSLLDVQHERDSVENKPASSLVVSEGKVLNEIASTFEWLEVTDDRSKWSLYWAWAIRRDNIMTNK